MFSFFSRGRQWASSFANEGRRKARPLRLGSAARDAPECPEFGAISHDALRICSALEIIILYKRKKCNSFSQYCCGLWGETDFSCKISIKGRNLSAKSLAEFAPAGANKVKIIFSGGKWVRLQERKARLVNKRESKSLILLLKLIQRSRTHAAHTSGKILLSSQTHEGRAFGAPFVRCSELQPLKREPSEAVSESQNL